MPLHTHKTVSYFWGVELQRWGDFDFFMQLLSRIIFHVVFYYIKRFFKLTYYVSVREQSRQSLSLAMSVKSTDCPLLQ